MDLQSLLKSPSYIDYPALRETLATTLGCMETLAEINPNFVLGLERLSDTVGRIARDRFGTPVWPVVRAPSPMVEEEHPIGGVEVIFQQALELIERAFMLLNAEHINGEPNRDQHDLYDVGVMFGLMGRAHGHRVEGLSVLPTAGMFDEQLREW
jgi:hypothetical protein